MNREIAMDFEKLVSILSLVLSPTFESGILALHSESDYTPSRKQPDPVDADTALLVLDALLSHLPDLLAQASPELVNHSSRLILRLQDAQQWTEVATGQHETDQQLGESIETIIKRLDLVIKAFRVYEQPIEPGMLNEAIRTICDLIAALHLLHVPGNAFVSSPCGDNVWVDQNAYKRMVAIEYAREQADWTRLELAAYAPHAQSCARRYLKQRHDLLYRMEILRTSVIEATANSTNATKRIRQTY